MKDSWELIKELGVGSENGSKMQLNPITRRKIEEIIGI